MLHLGAHKTGTSLVQKYFRDRRRTFLSRGIAPLPRSDGNRLIGWGELVVERPHRLRRRVDAEVRAGASTVLVSHENALGRPFVAGRTGLYPDAQELSHAIRATLDGIDLTVVFYVRPIAEFVESYYLQTIHEGAWHTFDEWASTVELDRIGWSGVVDALDVAFGRSRVMIGDFGEIGEGQDAFLRTFMARSGIRPPRVIAYQPRRNPSISEEGLTLALQLNPGARSRAERRSIRNHLQRDYSNVTGGRARPMPAEIRASLENSGEREYAQLVGRSRVGGTT